MSKGGKSTTTQENKVDPRLMNEFWSTYGDFNAMTDGKSFIPDFSQDTQDYFSGARDFQGSAAALRGIADQGPYLLGDAQGYTPGTYNAGAYTAGSYNAGSYNAGQAADVGDVGNITASQASRYINDYMNPYLNDVVDTSLADYDVGVDRSTASRAASRDAASAFGNRSAIADAVYAADAGRGRGALSAGLRAGAYDTALGAATGDANRFLSADMANQSTQAGNLNRRSGLNMFNTGAANDASRFNIGAANDASRFNIGSANDASRFNIGAANDASQFNIGSANDASRFAADYANRFAIGNQAEQGASDMRRLGAYGAADASDLTRLGMLGDVGARQDAYNYSRAQEPLDLMRQRLAYLSGIPIEQTTTNTQKFKPGLFDWASLAATAAGSYFGKK